MVIYTQEEDKNTNGGSTIPGDAARARTKVSAAVSPIRSTAVTWPSFRLPTTVRRSSTNRSVGSVPRRGRGLHDLEREVLGAREQSPAQIQVQVFVGQGRQRQYRQRGRPLLLPVGHRFRRQRLPLGQHFHQPLRRLHHLALRQSQHPVGDRREAEHGRRVQPVRHRRTFRWSTSPRIVRRSTWRVRTCRPLWVWPRV